MPCVSTPKFDYAPLREAVAGLMDERRVDYRELSDITGIRFAVLVRLMSGGHPTLFAHELVNLARFAGVPISELIDGGADDDRR